MLLMMNHDVVIEFTFILAFLVNQYNDNIKSLLDMMIKNWNGNNPNWILFQGKINYADLFGFD